MTKTKITLVIEEREPWTEDERARLDYLLADALYEFQAHRGGDYVDKKYASMKTPEGLEEKREQVRRRKMMAEDLRAAVLSSALTVEVIEVPETEE